jgi:hypothetical protein
MTAKTLHLSPCTGRDATASVAGGAFMRDGIAWPSG